MRAFILAPLASILCGCGCSTQATVQAHHHRSRGVAVETPVLVAPDARIAACVRFARPGHDRRAVMSFQDGGVLVQLRPGEECRTTSGYLMGVDK
jgi:hypothetical protein